MSHRAGSRGVDAEACGTLTGVTRGMLAFMLMVVVAAESARPQERSRVVATVIMFGDLANSLGAFGLGLVAEVGGYRGMYSVVLVLALAAAVLYRSLGFSHMYVYTCGVLALLALHVTLSSRTVKQTQVLYLLSITLLVVSGSAFVLLAHQTGAFSAALLSSWQCGMRGQASLTF